MAKLIKARQAAQDNWQLLKADEALPANGGVIVPLAVWKEQRDALLARGNVGVALEPNEEPGELAGDVAALPLIAVNFPNFQDGRGYSTARLLRERYGFKGELRAVGDVLLDELFYMSRVGFDAFALREDQNLDACLKVFDTFSEVYQVSVETPVPLFKRRLANA
ncbi:MAG TPA: DUF934 domain-containing protein [Burkholderiales bacterium]|nr:DUF934 domain-containing protein [Burkholderiales bacterium]